MENFFDDVPDTGYNRPKDPIWTLNLEDEYSKDVLNWLNGELSWLTNENQDIYWKITRNIALYRGIQYQDQETREEVRDRSEQRTRALQKMVINHIYDLTQQRVSRLIKYRPAVSILPTNDEMQDKVSAKMCKYLLDHIQYVQEFEDKKVPEFVRNTFIGGEGYLFITWDPSLGDIHPEYKKAMAKSEQVPMLDDQGNPKKDSKGNPIYIEHVVKTGDVKYENKLPVDVYYQLQPGADQTWEKTDYCFVREIVPTEMARQRYPEVASKIKSEAQPMYYDYKRMSLQRSDNWTTLWHFYHRDIQELARGRYIVFSKDTICSNTQLPYTHGKLPAVRMTDIDIPGMMRAMSFIDNIKQMAGGYNNLTNMFMRNAILVGHPKWMMPVGSANIEQLGNDITIVQYKGPTPPALVSSPTIPGDLVNFRDSLKMDMQIVSGVSGVQRGQPPPGIKAGVALQFLDEQDQERANESVMKFNRAIKEIAIMTLAVAGDYYDKDDGRFIRVIGKNNEWMTVFFDASHLYKDYDIRIQNSSALPQSRAMRMQTLLDLNQQFPDKVDGDQVLDLLDLAQNEKFIDLATQSIRMAEAENEMMLDGKEVEEPAVYEHHIKHWVVHSKYVQSYAYKYQTDPMIQDEFKEHLMVHEMLMYKKSLENPKFAEELKTLDLFPMFFTPRPNLEMLDANAQMQNQIVPPMEGLPQDMQMPVTEPNVPPLSAEMEIPPPPPGPIPPSAGV